MIIDWFPFFDELDLLEIRLNELSSVVDVFVLSEAAVTFTGKPKPMVYAENRDRFKAFAHKIEYVAIESCEGMRTLPRQMDRDQKQRALDVLYDRLHPGPSDVVVIGDADEIPRAESLRSAIADDTWTVAASAMPMYYYWLNCRNTGKAWKRSKFVRTRGRLNFRQLRYGGAEVVLRDAGWHFSFLGGIDSIQRKLAAYAHTEYDRPPFNTAEHIAVRLEAGTDLFDRAHQYEFVSDLSYLPKYVLANMDRFSKHLHTAS